MQRSVEGPPSCGEVATVKTANEGTVETTRVEPAAAKTADLRSDNIEIDFQSREVRIDGVPLELRVKEYDLLAFFALHPHQVFSRSELLEFVWHSEADWQQESTVTEHVHRLRGKITRQGQRHTINTVRGGGYRFDPRDGRTLAAHEVATAERIVMTMQRSLLRIGSAYEAAAILQLAVRQIGGSVVAAPYAGTDALPVDVALGVGPAMLVVAERCSGARMHLERYLPAMAEDAREAVKLLCRAANTMDDSR